jgi:bacteriocin biosynthesis cyclodehydratase domain-containing protein
MTSEPISSEAIYRSFPVQVIELNDGVLLRRGRIQVKIGGERAISAIQKILDATAGSSIPASAIYSLFAEQDRGQVEELLRFLKTRRLLVVSESDAPDNESEAESPQDVFYWHFGADVATAHNRLSTKSFAILGVNEISRRLAPALFESGATDLEVIDYPLLRNVRFFAEDGNPREGAWPAAYSPAAFENWLPLIEPDRLHCVVATSDFGGQHFLRQFNELCVEKKINFLPVVLCDLVGYVGPLVLPGETACLECLRARQNSNLDQFVVQRVAEEQSYEGQEVNGYLPSMASILADVAAVEIVKFFTGLPQMRAGHLIEINLLAGRMESAKVLKVPRCPVCSPLRKTPSIALRLASLLSSQGYNARYSG